MRKVELAVGVFILTCLLTMTFAKPQAPSTPDFVPPTVVSSVTPVFPITALNGGTVVVSISLDAAGVIQDVKILKSGGVFDSSALEAIKQWQFKPATLDGKPTPSTLPVAFSFGWPLICMGSPRK